MSREVRRVPLDYQHPTEPNPYWETQTAARLLRYRVLSLMHMPQVRFTPLRDRSILEFGEFQESDLMPDFGDVTLGFCLYETVSEGTPTTPVFATEEELIQHLIAVGEDYDQVPLRESSARALISAGWTPSGVSTSDGTFLEGVRDADLILTRKEN